MNAEAQTLNPPIIYDATWHRRMFALELAETLQACAAAAANSAFLGDDIATHRSFLQARMVLIEALPVSRELANGLQPNATGEQP